MTPIGPNPTESNDRLLIVSNRLPVTIAYREGQPDLVPSGGGLATGLRPWHQQGGGVWIGWPGNDARLDEAAQRSLDEALRAENLAPVHLSRDQVERYYQGFSNRVIWPLFHYLLDRVPAEAAAWDAYVEANQRFADAVIREYRPGDRIWVHDYQLMLVPKLIRDQLPGASIGFFLHIPFPSSEVFRALPWRRQLLEGLLGADLIGFHTYAYMRHFIASLLHVSGIEAEIDRVRVGDREVMLGAFPMGVDAADFQRRSVTTAVRTQVDEIRRECGTRQLVVGIDRLDYTKGIPRRLQAVERLLDQNPHLADSIRYIQVAVPTRGGVDAYQRFKRDIEQTIGRINGKYGTLHSVPVHYVHQSVTADQLSALYCAADVMLVTPLRDGMNLVAKEFVASRGDESGVLLLSEFAGAAAELDGALVVNPYDVEELSVQLRRALAMGAAERAARMR
jgi:trehalose 6-phosphate synthase/phosphatase